MRCWVFFPPVNTGFGDAAVSCKGPMAFISFCSKSPFQIGSAGWGQWEAEMLLDHFLLFYVCLLSHSVVSDSAIPQTVARQASLSMGILQARILEWVTVSSFRGSSQPRDWTQVSCTAGRFFSLSHQGSPSMFIYRDPVFLVSHLAFSNFIFMHLPVIFLLNLISFGLCSNLIQCSYNASNSLF